jgi:hypothetical protein
MPNRSLDNHLFDEPKSVLSWEQRFKIIKGLASGLLYLHEEWEKVVVHRDIKSGNVLSSHYFVKDLLTHKVLLEGKSENGLYPLQFGRSLHKGNKTFAALIGIRTTSLVWHFRLGHPSLDIVNRVVNLFLFLISIKHLLVFLAN